MAGMERRFNGTLRVWQEHAPAAVEELAETSLLPGPHHPAQFAERLYAAESMNPAACQPATDEGAEPYTLQWFLNIENQRHSRQGRWIPRLLEFAKHSGETLLGLGNGLGTDWLQYARHGAHVVVCSPSAEQLDLIRRNFELRGLAGRFLHSSASRLPLESSTIDVVCVSSLLDEIGDPRPVVEEVYRVLKPGGKVLAVTPARYDLDFWVRCCFPWRLWWPGRPPAIPGTEPARFSRRDLHRLFGRFVEHRIHRRQLRRSEIPHLWAWLPRPLLERLMGHLLVLKAFKPLSAAMVTPLAA
jgi:ubiquinone/menaquinone biosynthesis C-methylase UbiE